MFVTPRYLVWKYGWPYATSGCVYKFAWKGWILHFQYLWGWDHQKFWIYWCKCPLVHEVVVQVGPSHLCSRRSACVSVHPYWSAPQFVVWLQSGGLRLFLLESLHESWHDGGPFPLPSRYMGCRLSPQMSQPRQWDVLMMHTCTRSLLARTRPQSTSTRNRRWLAECGGGDEVSTLTRRWRPCAYSFQSFIM
jgi:hypothetical protein